METQGINIGDLIANKTADDSGKIIPLGTTSGVATWIMAHHGAGKGRVLQSNASTGMARSFSCNEYGTVAGAEWSSQTSLVPLGTTTNVGGVVAMIDLVTSGSGCTGTFEDYGNGNGYEFSYWSSNTSVATVTDPTGEDADVNGVAGGSATISGTVTDPEYDCEAGASGSVTVQVPTSLSVLSVVVLPNGSGPPNGCPGSMNYGIEVDIKYQVLDQSSPTPKAIRSSGMTPHENGTFYTGGTFNNNVGPTPGYPTSSATTASDGTFHDVPQGLCSALPTPSGGYTASQTLTMIIGSNSYTVRSQSLTVTAATANSFGHGTITNSISSPGTGSDISASR